MSSFVPKDKIYSYSRLYCALNEPEEFVGKYIFGIIPPPSDRMILGGIFQEAVCGATDWREKLAENNLRRFEAAIEQTLPQVYLPEGQDESKFGVDFGEGRLFGVMDRETPWGFVENKFGDDHWDEKKALTNEQVTMYSYMWFTMFGVHPDFIINSGSSKRKRNKIYTTIPNLQGVHHGVEVVVIPKRTEEDYHRWCQTFLLPGIERIAELTQIFKIV